MNQAILILLLFGACTAVEVAEEVVDVGEFACKEYAEYKEKHKNDGKGIGRKAENNQRQYPPRYKKKQKDGNSWIRR